MIPMAVGFATGYISHGATTGDWGWSAVGAGAIGAAVATIGFYSGGATSAASIASGFSQVSAGHAATVALGYSGRYVASAAISSIMPSMSVPVGDNFSVNVSPGIGFGSGGLSGGVSVSGTYYEGKNSYTLGGGLGSNYKAWGASASFNNGGFGIGYHRTYYGNAVGPDGVSNNQIVGGLTISSHQFAFRIENDFFGDGDDRWRSNAFELSLFGGDLTFGTSIYNNNVDETADPDPNGLNYIGKRNRSPYGAWRDGETYFSPAWIGVRSGNNIARGGMSHPLVQDRTQNVVHKWFGPGRTNFFNRYTYHQGGAYSYYGYQNPYSLW